MGSEKLSLAGTGPGDLYQALMRMVNLRETTRGHDQWTPGLASEAYKLTC